MLVFHRARDIVVIPDESVIIGISPKSFGAYYFSERQSEGYGFLDNRHIDESVRDFKEKYAFPGDLNNTNWLVSAEMARRVVESELDQPVDVDRYQVIQLLSLLREHFVLEKPYAETMGELACRLSRRENLIVELLRAILDAGEKEERTRLLAVMNRHIGQYPPSGYSQVLDIGHHHDISDAMAWLRNGRRAAAATDVNESSKTNSAGSPQEYRPEEKVRRPNDGWNDVVTRCRQVLARWLSP